jgi:hypothetical protein
VKETRFTLLKGQWNLTQADATRLAEQQESTLPRYRGYLLRESLAAALGEATAEGPTRALQA